MTERPRLPFGFKLIYRTLWWLLLPVALVYLFLRARKDRDYARNLGERFGRHAPSQPGRIWVHAVSLGELRSAVPLIRALLDRGEQIVTTHFTPAGRREAERLFADEIAKGNLRVCWAPLEFQFSYNSFLRAFQPKLGLSMEIEIWPEMIAASKRHDVPLYLCNAQYPKKSFERDMKKSRWRAAVQQDLAGALVKSDIQQSRFSAAGINDIAVTGELRFDQPVPADQLQAGQRLKARLNGRKVIALPSVVVGEDDIFMAAIKALKGPHAPLFIYIPRAPERFNETAQALEIQGFSIARRSDVLDGAFTGSFDPQIDVLLGDSMGEMYFYLALADLAIIGGSFVEKGAHNISEPLSLGIPCLVGPHDWTIEFPVTEAKSAGVCHQVKDADALIAYLLGDVRPASDAAKAFAQAQSGATKRTIDALVTRKLI